MSITLYDVAGEARVSKSTVSLVINKSNLIKEETTRKVLGAIKKLNYSPNRAAQSLVKKSISTIGLIIPHSKSVILSDPFIPEIQRGINSITKKNKFDLLLFYFDENEKLEDPVQIYQEGRAAGFITAAPRVNDPLIAKLLSEKIPFVCIGRHQHSSAPFVDADNRNISRSVVDYLISLKHRRIALITGSFNFIPELDVLNGYKKTLKKHNIPYEEELVIGENDITAEGGYKAAKKLLNHSSLPTAIFVANDLMVFGVMRAIKEKGLQIPQDISLVGYDSSLTSQVEPPLTAVASRAYDLGRVAVEILLKMIMKEKLRRKQVILKTNLIIRNSCSTARKYLSTDRRLSNDVLKHPVNIDKLQGVDSVNPKEKK
ncbi:MAG: LacI family DNA-binding transcriptional regulator [bacterium]